MKFIVRTFLVMLFVGSLRAASSEGTIQLKYLHSAFDKGVFNLVFGDKAVKATCAWYAGDFFGKETVFAGVTVENDGGKPMSYNYYVAFYDKDKKLVAAAGQGSMDDGLAPGEDAALGSCLIALPKGRYKDIVSYQAVIYEREPSPAEK